MIEQPKITHLGMKSGEWPVRAFTAAHHAAAYAAENDRHYVWAVESITLGPALTAEIIPASFNLRPAARLKDATPCPFVPPPGGGYVCAQCGKEWLEHPSPNPDGNPGFVSGERRAGRA